MEIILASASPRRKELLQTAGIPFTVRASNADETMEPGLPPYLMVEQLSLLKASDVARKLKAEGQDAIVIGADTIVVCDGEILTKPKDTEDAKGFFLRFPGNGTAS